MAVFVQQGSAVDYTPGAATPAGTVVVQGDLVGIVKHDIPANKLGGLAVEGVFDVEKEAATVFAAGDKVYWDGLNLVAVTTATGNKLMGKAVAAAGNGPTSVRVRLSQ